MMAQREFLGWDRPFLGVLVDWLWARRAELPGMCVVVPTAQSGRALRQALAERGGCLAPRVTTPGRLMETEGVACESAEVLAWVEALEAVRDWAPYEAAFPLAPGMGEEAGWAMALARSMAGVRRSLQENGWTMASAARAMAESVDAERWQALAALESLAEKTLQSWGLASRTRELARRAAEGMETPGRIVLAGVADFPPVLARALKDHGATVLVAAPEGEAEHFDDWGRPVPEAWCNRVLEWPETGEVRLCADPRQQATEAARLAAEAGTPSDELVLGSADEETAGELEREFTRRGWVAHNPAGARIAPEAQWFAAWRAFLAKPGAAETIDLLGMPETGALTGGKRAQRAQAVSMLRDRWMLRDSEDLARIEAMEQRSPDSVALARETFERLERRRGELLRGNNFAETMDRLLERIDPAGEMTGVREWLESMRDVFPAVRRGAAFWIDLMGAELAGRGPEPPEDRAIDVQGWLELLHENGRHLIVCGMNEGMVPSPIASDTWMPEGTRKCLGLATDESRAARDAFLLRSMIEARRGDSDRVDLLLAKSSAGGDSLLPSRLLLAADPADLPGRVEVLFADIEPPDAGLAWTADWKWTPRLTGDPPERLSVTAFAAYLACPFRFYLRYVLRMQKPEPERVEWNARDFGIVAHEVLENWGRNVEARDFSKAEALEEWLLAELERVAARRFGKRPPLAVRIQLESLRQRLAWFARRQACERAEGWQIEAVEKKFEIPLGGLTVVGMVDRIERHDDGRRRVMDYKTFAEKKKVEREHRKKVIKTTVIPPHLEGAEDVLCECTERNKPVTKLWTNLQVPLYAAELGDIDEIGYFVIGATEEHVGLELWQNFGEADMQSARRCAEWVIARVRDRAFWPPSEKMKYDDFTPLSMGGRPLSETVDPG
jgi:ATP-dependent helicase/nuclease subunit B